MPTAINFTYPCLAIKKTHWAFTMVTLYVEASELKNWCGVYRKAITQEGYQRTLKPEHFAGIKRFLDTDEERNVIPNSIVIAFNDSLSIDGETKEGASLEITSRSHPHDQSGQQDTDTEYLIGNLTVRVHPDCLDRKISEGPRAEELLSDLRSAYVIDGQHRIEGGNASSVKVYYPVTAFLGVDKEDQAFHFIVINSKAKKVSKHDIDAVIPKEIYEELQSRLGAAGIYTTVADIVWALDNDPDSPFLQKIKWANNSDPNAPIGKGGIDSLYKKMLKLPQDIKDRFESEVDLIKATWKGIQQALGDLWDCGADYKLAEDLTYTNQFHKKSAAILPALQCAFNTAVSTGAIRTNDDNLTADALTTRVAEYFGALPAEFFYCQWEKKSITNDDRVEELANLIVTACRTQKVPYSDKSGWFKEPISKEAILEHKRLEREQRKKSAKAKKRKRAVRKSAKRTR